MYYSKPVFGRAFKPFSKEMVDVTPDNVDQWKFKKTLRWGRQEYALYFNSKGEEIMQSLRAIRHVRLRPGEENYMSKLTNEQGLEVYRRAVAGENKHLLAKEFGITPRHVDDIKNVRIRIGVTLNYLNGESSVQQKSGKVKTATRDKRKKLSISIAKFIHSDAKVQKMNVKQLAKKYCVSPRTIQRILKGDMYKGSGS